MLEKIRNWIPHGDINIKYTSNDGTKKPWTCPQMDLLSQIMSITKDYEEMGIKLTNRQMYYQLVAIDYIPNAMEIYKRISKFITDARYGGFLDWDLFEDRGRKSKPLAQWDNIKSILNTTLKAYRLPRWNDQKYYLELLCEKQALESVLQPIAQNWHVRFGYNKGYTSAASMYELYQRLIKNISSEHKTVILYFGDHDPSGLDMIRDITERITEFLMKGDMNLSIDQCELFFSVDPIALTMAQVNDMNPPPNPAKITDPRAKSYIREHGNVSWELDAIDPLTLQNLAEEAILTYLDVSKYDKVVQQEKEEAEALQKFADTL